MAKQTTATATPVQPEVMVDEPRTEALLPAVPGAGETTPGMGGIPLTDAKRLRTRLREYDNAREVLRKWLFTKLVPGVDFILIHTRLKLSGQWVDCPKKDLQAATECDRCGGRPTLCKPGSEKICGLLQLQPKFRRDQDVVDMLGIPGVVAFICELTTLDGRVVAEGRAARHYAADLPKAYDNKPQPGPEKADLNKTIKMCQKSAQIDATIRLAGLSEAFTQDLDDPARVRAGHDLEGPAGDLTPMPEKKKAGGADRSPAPGAGRGTKAAAPTPAQAPASREPGEDDVPPQAPVSGGEGAELHAIFELAAQHGKTEAAVRIYAAQQLGVRTLEQADAATLAKLRQFAIGRTR